VVGAFAIKHRIAMICSFRLPGETTCLMWHGPNLLEQFRQTADYVHRILNGAKVAELPVQQPYKFAFIVNATTAKALRLKIPQSFLLSADEITK
jgi:putative tryptophan/tyrosine transport system substrate-binding protein